MHHLSFLSGLGAVVASSLLVTASPVTDPNVSSVDSFLATEAPIAIQGILDNIGPSGKDASGASAGIVIASPSKSNPDCTYFLCSDLNRPSSHAHQTSIRGPETRH